MQAKYRIALISILLLTTGGLCVQYASADLYDYPSTEAIDSTPNVDEDTQVFLFGEVQSINGEKLEMDGTLAGSPEQTFAVTGVDAAVRNKVELAGNAIQVYGTVDSDGATIAADRIVVDFRHTRDRIYVYGSSLLGALVGITVFLRHWRVNIRELGFEPRRDQ